MRSTLNLRVTSKRKWKLVRAGLAGLAVPGTALGGVEPIPGPFRLPEVVANIRYEVDEPNTVSWQVSGNLHQIPDTANVPTN